MERKFQFEWDPVKASANQRKHGITFDLARTVFNDERLLSVADVDHSETEERWFSIGNASNGAILSVVHLWSEASSGITTIRLISARNATRSEIRYYQDGL